MASIRPLLLALTLPTTLVACGGGGSDTPTPEGTHYTYVASEVLVPTNNTQAREFGIDLNNDGTVDNQLGMVLGTLAGRGIAVQDELTGAINEGGIILLVDFQTKNFESSNSGFTVKLGATPMPAPCTNTADPATCGQHLKGTGTFTVSASSPNDATLAGKLAGGTFNGGPGNVSLQIALGGSMPITLDLIGARVKASGLSETGMTSVVIGGAISEDDLNTQVLPAIHNQILPLIMRDCPGTTPPACGCTDGSTGETILNLFDSAPKNCMVTLDEIKGNSLIQSLLAPDVEIDGTSALSLGIKAKAVKATFPTP